MLTPTTLISVMRWRELPTYVYHGTLDRAIQTCPYTDADERLAMLCEEYGTDTATLPESHIWGSESHLHRLCDAGVPDEDVIRCVLDCHSVSLLKHDCETRHYLNWYEVLHAEDGEQVHTIAATAGEWTPMDDSEKIPATADREAPEDYQRAEDALLTRDDLTDETSYL